MKKPAFAVFGGFQALQGLNTNQTSVGFRYLKFKCLRWCDYLGQKIVGNVEEQRGISVSVKKIAQKCDFSSKNHHFWPKIHFQVNFFHSFPSDYLRIGPLKPFNFTLVPTMSHRKSLKNRKFTLLILVTFREKCSNCWFMVQKHILID